MHLQMQRYYLQKVQYLRNRKHVLCFYRVIETGVEVIMWLVVKLLVVQSFGEEEWGTVREGGGWRGIRGLGAVDGSYER